MVTGAKMLLYSCSPIAFSIEEAGAARESASSMADIECIPLPYPTLPEDRFQALAIYQPGVKSSAQSSQGALRFVQLTVERRSMSPSPKDYGKEYSGDDHDLGGFAFPQSGCVRNGSAAVFLSFQSGFASCVLLKFARG